MLVDVERMGLAVRNALEFGGVPCRVMGWRVMFPDIGEPVVVEVGFLRYPGEPIQGEAEQVAAWAASGHNV